VIKLSKTDIIQALKEVKSSGNKENIIDAGYLKNLQIFGDQVDIDLRFPNPSLQARKKMEVDILKIIHQKVYEKAKINIKTEVVRPPSSPNPKIRGKAIEGVDSIIAISSGKGGVGKSTVAANIAVTLAKMGLQVGLLDADIYGPSIPTMFDLERERPLSVRVRGKEKMEPIENYGVKVLSIGFFTKPGQAIIWRGPMASKALNQLIFDAAWGNLDFLIVDLPPGTGDIHLSIVQAIPLSGAVVVSTPQHIALSDARKGIAMFQQENISVPVLGIIENMSYFSPTDLPDKKYYIFGMGGAQKLAEDKRVPFLGEVPLIQSIREASDFGRPAALQDGGTIVDSYVKITQNMVHQLLKRNKDLPPTKVVEITTMTGCSAIK